MVIEDQEKCTKQRALTASRNVKYRSNLRKASLSTAGNAFRSTNQQEDSEYRI
jgi:hypothetical protein